MSVVSKKFSASLDSMLVLLLLCLVTAFSSGCGSKASYTVPIVLDSQKERFFKVLTLKKGDFLNP